MSGRVTSAAAEFHSLDAERPSLFYLGFDPGGVGAFGWAVAERTAALPHVIASGRAPNAEIAVRLALGFLKGGELAAIGIDAPLFWTPTGIRRADAIVRRELHVRSNWNADADIRPFVYA